MKKMRNISVGLVLVFLLLVVAAYSYSVWKKQTHFIQYPDDYVSVSSIENHSKWGVYNVHDPAGLKWGDFYYVFSTDAIWISPNFNKDTTIKTGHIQVRRSRDLVNWEFVGWAIDSIPFDAKKWVNTTSNGKLPNGIWAPYAVKYNNECRLYYSVSIFGANTSYIGMLKSNSPEGPYEDFGCVVKTSALDSMNAIDPTVITDYKTGKMWMLYGSYFAGLYCLELDPISGLAKVPGNKGHVVARRAEGKVKIIEAPEVIYNKKFNKYYLFVSYDALFSHYNIRVGRADKPEGPYYDYFGKNLSDTTNNYPVITYAYRFQFHPGWAGVGHCGIIQDNEKYFMLHQGRLAPSNEQMVLHVRQIFWTNDGWPVVSPQRYVNIPQSKIKADDIVGKWEIIRLNELAKNEKLWQGQVPWGGWKYDTTLFNNSVIGIFKTNGSIETSMEFEKWKLNSAHQLTLFKSSDSIQVILSKGWDWELNKSTLIFTGIDKNGLSIWAKKIGY